MVSDKLKEAFYYSLKNTECTKKVIGNDLVMNYYYLFNSDKVFYKMNHWQYAVQMMTLSLYQLMTGIFFIVI